LSGVSTARHHRLRDSADDDALIDRLHQLRLILPALATETAIACREAARLRIENARLAERVAELEAASASSHRVCAR